MRRSPAPATAPPPSNKTQSTASCAPARGRGPAPAQDRCAAPHGRRRAAPTGQLESKILEFFAQRTASALSYASHFTDDTDSSFLVLEPDSQADLLTRLSFSTYTLTEHKIRPLKDQEFQITVSSFLDLRPDGYAIHQKSEHLAMLEFTRAMDSSEDWEEKKDAEKRSRYAPVLEFFNSLRERQGWTSSTSRWGFADRSPLWMI